ncbi:hypothetical protein EVAR_89108_1 [Eumeta japonica]|uniref:Reverse transcriptase domain-containing protein n=1 Tax=Eumeta variegata TaxID=151549 RepID=A0A4C1XE71_EUMVA|nr:hypothetical protein EVAR_89108_1 [Eumeta japonica]
MKRSMMEIKMMDKVRSALIREKTGIIDIISRIDQQKWRWTGLMIRRPQEKWSKIVSDWSPETANVTEDANSRVFRASCPHDLKVYEDGLRMDELAVKRLLYAEDHVILVPSVCELQEMVTKINDCV